MLSTEEVKLDCLNIAKELYHNKVSAAETAKEDVILVAAKTFYEWINPSDKCKDSVCPH